MGNQTFIEINGNKYDAITGKMIKQASSKPASPKASVQPQQGTGAMDGFVRRPPSQSTTQYRRSKPIQKSQTLARSSVKKPQPTYHPVKKQTGPVIKPSLKAPADRVARAHTIKKSQAIQKYTASTHTTVATGSELARRDSSQIIQQQKPTNQPHKSQNTAHRQSKSASLIEQALLNSQDPQAPAHLNKKRRHRISKKLGVSSRITAISSLVLAAVLFMGFFAVQNVPNISMRVASTRAGFEAQMPKYRPSGFSFKGPINYQAGKVVVTFKSNTDSREYSLTQTNSNWNSDALLANYISSDKKQYQTYLDKGRTLYIYDESNATWVDNGVWYKIEGKSSLTTDQLIRIASSL